MDFFRNISQKTDVSALQTGLRLLLSAELFLHGRDCHARLSDVALRQQEPQGLDGTPCGQSAQSEPAAHAHAHFAGFRTHLNQIFF